MSLFDLVTAQEVQVEPGRANTIDLVAAAGVSQEALRDRVDTTLPSTFEVISGEGLTEESRNEVADALSFLNTFMLIFAAIALFVASFIIFDTFSIVVAQRSKELGLLRALGASRRQVLGSVLLEAVIVGVIASIVGLLGGLGVAAFLKQVLAAVGISIPTGQVAFSIRTRCMAILVGAGATAIAALGRRCAGCDVNGTACCQTRHPASHRRLSPLCSNALHIGLPRTSLLKP